MEADTFTFQSEVTRIREAEKEIEWEGVFLLWTLDCTVHNGYVLSSFLSTRGDLPAAEKIDFQLYERKFDCTQNGGGFEIGDEQSASHQSPFGKIGESRIFK